MVDEYILDLEKLVGLEKSFTPHYQFDKPLEFYSLVNHYMQYNYKGHENPELYMVKMRYAVDYANKSILADRLGVDSEEVNSDIFKKSMIELASDYNDLDIVDGEIFVSPMLEKSFVSRTEDKNFAYERLAKQVFEQMER